MVEGIHEGPALHVFDRRKPGDVPDLLSIPAFRHEPLQITDVEEHTRPVVRPEIEIEPSSIQTNPNYVTNDVSSQDRIRRN